jgi:glyoxylase-like metal-dependent hydrolase (beta-lactamase superfamily II)
MKWTTFNLTISNAHLLRGGRPILVDSGPPGRFSALCANLRSEGIKVNALGAVVLTHGHADHAGTAAEFLDVGVPVLLGAEDLPLATSGKNPDVRSTGLTARALRPFLPWTYSPFTPTTLVKTSIDLSPFGLDGVMKVVGGHSLGSSVVIVDDLLLAGDLVRGGYLGGTLFKGQARIHYYSDDPASDLEKVATLIDEHRPLWVLLGHGGPLKSEFARRRIDSLIQGLRRT